jgi:3-phenylpropionate/trans-cinnamate dioxygenase ferredoxin subunit
MAPNDDPVPEGDPVPEDEVTIGVLENAAYRIRGPIRLLDGEGRPIPFEGAEVELCRCGHSANKPFCDGSHERVGFQSAPRVGERRSGR